MTDQITRGIRNFWFPIALALLGFCGTWGVGEVTGSFKTMTIELANLSKEVALLNNKLDNNVLITRAMGDKIEKNANETRKTTTELREKVLRLEMRVKNLEGRPN